MERTDDTLAALGAFDSATVFNAVVEIRGAANEDYTGPEIRYMLPEFGTVVGYAVTSEVTPLEPGPSPLSWDAYYDHLNETPGPMIAVMKDVDARPRRAAIFGDGMAHLHKALGVVGAVVDGCVRDVAGIRAVGLPIFAGGAVPGHGPFHVRRFGSPVTVGRLTVDDGDLLLGDADGVVRIPVDIAGEVVRVAEEIRTRERVYFGRITASGFTYASYKAWRDAFDKKRG